MKPPVRPVSLLAASALALAGAIHACVPSDTRPVPASLTLTVSPSQATRSGVLTADGWTLTFDRVLLGIGRASLGTSCVSYSEANYDRLIDVTRGPQKLSILHGLGHCDLRMRIASPSSEALLGDGVTEEDRIRMRTPGKDKYVSRGGISVDVRGSARRGEVIKRFDFVFRSRIAYRQCSLSPDGGASDSILGDGGDELLDAGGDSGVDPEAPPEGMGVVLNNEAVLVRDFRIEAEALFRDAAVAAAASLRFDPYAAADTDGDGVVTLAELENVPIALVRDGGAFEAGTAQVDAGGRSGQTIPIQSLGDLVYVVLLPTLPRFGEVGACGSDLGIDRRPDGGADGGPG